MKVEFFMTELVSISIITGLVTESIKNICDEHNWKYHANTLAGLCAFIISISVGVCYIIYNSISFTPQVIVSIVALTLLSWLCSMVGYDKVIQSVRQITKG